MHMGSYDETITVNMMEMMLEYIKGQVHLEMPMRSEIYLWMRVSSLEDGLTNKITLLLRVVLSLTD